MAQIIIDIGATPDDSLGTPLRQAFADINQMFAEVYQAGPAASNIRISNNAITTTVVNSNLILNPSGIGKIQFNNSVFPAVNDVYDLGSPTQRFNTVYIGTGGFNTLGNITAGGLDISGNITATGNITGDFFVGNGRFLTGIDTTVISNGATEVRTYENGNIAFTVNGVANLVVLSQQQFTIDTDTVINGNLTVDGDVKYINVENLNVRDPIIGLGRGANDAPLTDADGFDRGTQLWYFDTEERSAFFGYDHSTGKLIAATDVEVANEVVSVNNYGTIAVGNVEAENIEVAETVAANNVSVTGAVVADRLIGDGSEIRKVLAARGDEPSSNWNNITKMGVYTINRTSWSGTKNTPTDSQVFVGILEVKSSTDIAVTQTFWPGTVDTADVRLMWVRNYWDDTWTNWQKMVNGNQTIDGGNQF
jgi:hypothetical protein